MTDDIARLHLDYSSLSTIVQTDEEAEKAVPEGLVELVTGALRLWVKQWFNEPDSIPKWSEAAECALAVAIPAIERPLKEEIERLRLQYEAVREFAVAQDAGRLCDGNDRLIYSEQWERSTAHVDQLAKAAVEGE